MTAASPPGDAIDNLAGSSRGAGTIDTVSAGRVPVPGKQPS